jgi:hypothetical protein
MSDDLTKRGRQDRERISLSEDYEVRYECQKYGITEARLREVIAEVGHMRADVEAFLTQDDCGE